MPATALDSGEQWAVTSSLPEASWRASAVEVPGEQNVRSAFPSDWRGAGRRDLDQRTRLADAGSMQLPVSSGDDEAGHQGLENDAPHCSWPSPLFRAHLRIVSPCPMLSRI